MADIKVTTIVNNETVFSLILFAVCLYFLLTYKRRLNVDALLDYFVFLINKIILFFLTMTFLFVFIVTLTSNDFSGAESFFKEVFLLFLYYMTVNYGILFGIKFIYYGKEFFKQNDLFAMSYLDKLKIHRGGKK